MKNHFRNLWFCSIALLFCGIIYGQKEKPKYIFKMDEVSAEFESELKAKKVDTILQAFYHFDNGRGNKATKIFFWTKNGNSYVKAITTKKNNRYKEFNINDCPEFNDILDFFSKNESKIKSSEPKSKLWISHNYGYSITLELNSSEYNTYLRDEKRLYDKEHYKSKWVSLIDIIAKEYIEK